MNSIDSVFLEQEREFYHIINMKSGWDHFIAANACNYRDINGITNCLQYFQRKFYPIAKASTILISTIINCRRNKLCKKVTVTELNFNNIKTGLNGSFSCIRKHFNYIVHHFLVHFHGNCTAVFTCFTGR